MNLEAHYRKRAIDRIDDILTGAARVALHASDGTFPYPRAAIIQLTKRIRTDALVALDALHHITPRQGD